VLVGIGAPDFEARRAGHAVPQRLDAPRADLDPIHVEELDVGNRAAVDLIENLVGIRPLDLKPVMRAIDRLTVRTAVGARIVSQADFVLPDRLLEFHPIGRRGAADEHELIRALAKHDHVADHMPGGRDRDEVLGTVQVEVRKAVDADVLEERGCVGAFDDQLVHVMSLVEQHGRFAPRDLFVSPVRELRRDDRVDVHPDLRVAQQFDGIAMRLDHGA
jgi:hypothetical protein